MKRNIRYINIIFLALTFGLLFASCSMAGAQKESSVSFKLDSETVQKIRNAAGKTAKPNARAADDDNLFVEVAVHGGYEDSDIVPLQKEAIVSIDKIPVGSEIYVEAIAFKQTGETRQDLYKGQSKTFKVLNSDNFVMFIMHKVGTEEESGSSNSGNGNGGNSGGGGSGGSGTGGSSGAGGITGNVLFVANSEIGGAASNDGSEAHPLDSIAGAVAKIVEAAESGEADKGADWTIMLLSDISGAQTIDSSLDGNAGTLLVTSSNPSEVKAIVGRMLESSSGLTVASSVPITLKDIEVKNFYYYSSDEDQNLDFVAWSDKNAGLVVEDGATVTMTSGATISGNAPAGVWVESGATFKMNGGSVKENGYHFSTTSLTKYYGLFVKGDFYMTDGKISTSDSEGGKGVILDDGDIYLSGSAVIEENSPVILGSDGPGRTVKTIHVTGVLNPEGQSVTAKIADCWGMQMYLSDVYFPLIDINDGVLNDSFTLDSVKNCFIYPEKNNEGSGESLYSIETDATNKQIKLKIKGTNSMGGGGNTG